MKLHPNFSFSVIQVVQLLHLIPIAPTEANNILFMLGFSTYSHRINVWPVVEKLADLGHNVTFFSAHYPKGSVANPKVTEVVPPSLVEFNRNVLSGNLLNLRLQSEYQGLWNIFPEVSIKAYELLAEDKDFLRWYETAQFDLIIMDSFFSDFGFGLVHKFKANYIIFSTSAPYMWQYDAVGMPFESSWLPDLQMHYPDGNAMSIGEKIMNTLRPIKWHLERQWFYYPALEKLFRERLGLTDIPSFTEIEKNVSLVLTNTYFAEEYGRSVPPLVVPVGGLHCFQSKDTTPKDMELFMNKSTSGFIYVSFGSAAKLSVMPTELRKIFFNAMTNAKTNFIVKWEGDVLEDLPKNVFPASWLPQQNILSHPNVKAFITHGGLLGIQEAICSGVPVIVFPMFAEQDYNANRIHKKQRGIKLELRNLTQKTLDDAINSILTDPMYKRNMAETSKLFLDRPVKAVDLAVWWTEYILRHGHVESLKPLGIYQTWYQRRLLDVWFLLFAAVTGLLLLLVGTLLYCCCRTPCQTGTNSRKSENRRQKKQN